MSRCRDKVDVIITDSPLPLSIFYNHDEVLGEDFNRTVMNVFNSYNNINFLLLRTKPYNPNGRMQTEAESDALKKPMINLLNEREIPYTEVNGDIGGYEQIINNIVYELDYLRHKDEICFDDFCIVPVCSDKPTHLQKHYHRLMLQIVAKLNQLHRITFRSQLMINTGKTSFTLIKL